MREKVQAGIPMEWQLLLRCVQPACDPPGILALARQQASLSNAIALAEDHGLLPLVADALEKSGAFGVIAPEVLRTIQESRRSHLLFGLGLQAELYRIVERFTSQGLESVPVKGPVLSVQAFGNPSLRQYADIDLLVRHQDVFRAIEIMQELGFSGEVSAKMATKKIPGQFLFIREQTRAAVELHTERTLRYFPRPLPIDDFLRQKETILLDGQSIAALRPADTLVFICVHGSKHFWEKLLWIADVAGLVTRRTGLNWEQAFDVAAATGAERMVRLGLLLAVELLGAKIPAEVLEMVYFDKQAESLAAEIRGQLMQKGGPERSAFQRARLRMQLCGNYLRGSRFLLRLAFRPTAEDWEQGETAGSRGWLHSVRRPFRLYKKYQTK